MSNRPYHKPKLVGVFSPLMYEFIKMLQVKNIHPCPFATIFKEIIAAFNSINLTLISILLFH